MVVRGREWRMFPHHNPERDEARNGGAMAHYV